MIRTRSLTIEEFEDETEANCSQCGCIENELDLINGMCDDCYEDWLEDCREDEEEDD